MRNSITIPKLALLNTIFELLSWYNFSVLRVLGADISIVVTSQYSLLGEYLGSVLKVT